MERPKTYAERQLEREEALQRLEQQRTGSGERPCSITSSDIPDQIARPKPSKVFVRVGIAIIVFLIVAQIISFLSSSSSTKKGPKPQPTEAIEAE